MHKIDTFDLRHFDCTCAHLGVDFVACRRHQGERKGIDIDMDIAPVGRLRPLLGGHYPNEHGRHRLQVRRCLGRMVVLLV